MPNLSYVKGRNAEYRCIKALEKEGYLCVRGAGSKGIDVVAFLSLAFNPQEKPLIRAISVKATKYVGKKDIKEIKGLKLPLIVSKELWHYSKKGLVIS